MIISPIRITFATYLINHREYSDIGWDYKASNSQIISEMEPNETKINAILDAIGQDIEIHENLIETAFATLEKMTISDEEYNAANRQLGLSAYIAGYLRNLIELTVAKEPLKTIENRMRFHAHSQRTKGELDDDQEISEAQKIVAVLLEGYVQKFFETAE